MDDTARKQLFEEFKQMITTETVVGEPMYLGDATIVPFVDISFGFGTGQTGTDGKSGAGAGGGKVSPTAVLILKGERMELFSIKNAASASTMDKLLNMVPEVISHFQKKKEIREEARKAAEDEIRETLAEEESMEAAPDKKDAIQ